MKTELLTLITAILGGGNLLQFAYLWQTKRQQKASADLAELSVRKERKHMDREETSELMAELDEMRKKIIKLNSELLQYLDEVSDLKSKVRYLQTWTCYRGGCEQRLKRQKNEEDTGLSQIIDRCK